jgi:ERF superfamily
MTKPNIAQRINAAMADVDYVQKEKKQGMNYSIVSHDAVTAKVRPILQTHGVVYYPHNMNVTQDGNRTAAFFNVRFENIDDRADFIDVATFGYGVDPQDKGPGKAISYGVKYALLKVMGMETGDDPDTVQDSRADYKPANDASERINNPVKHEKKAKAEPLAGPYTSKSTLWAAARKFTHELHGCGDSDMLEAFLADKDSVALLAQCERDAPSLLRGNEIPDYVPIDDLIAKMRRDFENLENNVLRAG